MNQRIVDNDRFEVFYVRGDADYPTPVLANAGTSGDAFGRLRTSDPFTLFDSQHRYQENDKWDTALNGGGTKTYRINESAIDLTVPVTSGAYVYRETKKVFTYQPGKSLLVLSSFVFAAAKANLRQRIGYFGTQNGVYLEQDGTTKYFVMRSYTTGGVVNTRIAQTEWNGDKLDGTGVSGHTVDLSKTQILWFDIEWLGVGDARCGVVVDGRMVVAHTFHGDNVNPTTYMTTAVLPLRQEIENTAATASSSTAKHICSSVVSEGGYSGFSRRYNLATGSTARTLATAGTMYPIMAIKLNSSRLDSVVIPANISAAVEQTTNNKLDIVQYHVLINPTLTGGTWNTHFNGNVDYNTSITSHSAGTEIAGGYLTSSSSLTLNNINDFNFQLGRSIAGVSDTILIAVTPTNDGAKLFLDLAWFELV
jgi:hypothetical protein